MSNVLSESFVFAPTELLEMSHITGEPASLNTARIALNEEIQTYYERDRATNPTNDVETKCEVQIWKPQGPNDKRHERNLSKWLVQIGVNQGYAE